PHDLSVRSSSRLFFSCYGAHRHLHSFPTRRSSDLKIEIVQTDAPGMAAWRKRLFLATAHVATDAVEYFKLPRRSTVLLGSAIERSEERRVGKSVDMGGRRVMKRKIARCRMSAVQSI